MQTKGPLTTFFVTLLIGFFTLFLSGFLSGCGSGLKSAIRTREQKNFVDSQKASGEDVFAYSVRFNRNDLSQITRPSDAPEERNFNSSLAKKIKNVKISKKESSKSGFQVQMKIRGIQETRSVIFDIDSEVTVGLSLLANDNKMNLA